MGCSRAEELGAGEILLTSMDTDGVQKGFDCRLTKAVAARLPYSCHRLWWRGKPEDFYKSISATMAAGADAALAASIFHYGTYTVRDLKAFPRAPASPVRHQPMIFPCIDLMDGKVVQLVQGREKALGGRRALEMLRQVAGVSGNSGHRSGCRHGARGRIARWWRSGRDSEHAASGRRSHRLSARGDLLTTGPIASSSGTAAFSPDGANREDLQEASAESRRSGTSYIALDSKHGKIVVKGWQEATDFTAEQSDPSNSNRIAPGFLCTYVDKEGMMQGTDIDWFIDLRNSTSRELIAAASGGITTMEDVRALNTKKIHCAIGMSIYTGRLDLSELRQINQETQEQSQ